MYSNLFKRIGLFLISMITVFLLGGCGGSGGGETSDNTLLDDNKPPVAFDQNITIENLSEVLVDEDGNVSIALRAVDEDNDLLTYTILTYPTHGHLVGTAPLLAYIPDPNYTGEDQFTFQVNDGTVDSQVATIRVVIASVNDAPVAHEQNLTTSEDTPLSLILTGSDEENDTLTYTVTTTPSHGTLSGTAPTLTYSPEADYAGSDSIVFKVNDGTVDSAEATVSIIVTPVNDAPIAHDDNASTDEDTNVTIDVLSNDGDSDGTLNAASLHIITAPAHGTATIMDGAISYSPEANYYGADRFTYTVKDDEGLRSNEACVNILIDSVNDLPIANDDSTTTDEGLIVSLEPLLNDRDTDGNSSKLHMVSITQPHYGIALLEGNAVHYTPKSDSASQDTLTYIMEDEDGGRATATITITIVLYNDAPIAHGQTIETNEDQAISFELNGTDPDGDDINYTLLYTEYVPEHGILSGEAPRLTYTPNANFTGEDYIVFKVDDGQLESEIAVVKILIHPLNDPPTAIAGGDASGIRGDSFVLDGSQSYDVDGNITAYEWREGNITLSTEEKFSQKFYDEGVHTITLTVTDDHNTTDSDEKIITIDPCCKGCIYPDPTETNPFN